ncbi:MAG TPA: UDP binding domain-containing protein, partial [Longimicrobiales bacterium]|nr:UDP binding domain-containing protein [Longimicrobiales bacterium]
CFPKDVKALIRTLGDRGLDSGILDAVERVNEGQKQALLNMIDEAFPDGVRGRRFGVWGLSFKPETDDMREAPSIVVIEGLLERGAEVAAHDPEAIEVAQRWFGDRIRFAENNYDALNDADALVIITEWKQYRQPDFERIRKLLRQPVIFDGRNLFNPGRMHELGFDYASIGRPRVKAAPRVAAR